MRMTHFHGHQINTLAQRFGTPTWVYHQGTIEERIKELSRFDTIRYAQKANSNLSLLRLMNNHRVYVDAVTAGEIHRALLAGYRGGRHTIETPHGQHHASEIVYTADVFDEDAMRSIATHKITVNIGSPDMIEQLADFAPGTPILFRVNPGFGHGHSKKVNTGGEFSKHGIWHTQLPECIRRARDAKLPILGLHLHIGSGTDIEHLKKVAHSLEKLLLENDLKVEVISAGGGIPIPYREGEERIQLSALVDVWLETKKRIEERQGGPVQLEIEPGRFLVAEAGILIARICSVKKSGSVLYYLIDAGFDTLIRPAMYGAYHRLAIAKKDGSIPDDSKEVVVAGPLCESCDVFTQEEGGVVTTRVLPTAEVGDYVVILDAGAYGASMSSNYNSRRLAAEALITKSDVKSIRTRQPIEDLTKYEVTL